ncbi:ABC transporter ATP-binding protein [Candidatus Lokiarchaeum ossiferum]|uniref:ABC transporter ATP-binding protein n=1 Tax=Candidatus Lokiarchaeum ossiferum TaxID=2951803 RepID=UPI00352CC348
MVKIRLENLNFKKDGVQILSNVNLTIEDKEYAILVGPTGAGKTSLIGLISGLYTPTSGKIYFDERDVTTVPSNERHCGVMFESYALFPHLHILDNVSYARHMQESNHEETYSISQAVLNLVRLSNRDFALPKECSGGMQQRVALARAIMALEEGGLLVLDEPFKALDAGLRLNLRREVKNIAKSTQLNLTTIHVTNDMQEAMLADKIIVLDQGKIRQIGTPKEIMYSPIDLFVANFFSTELNYFSGKIIRKEPVLETGFKKVPLEKCIIQSDEGYFLYAKTEKKFEVGEEVTFLIRSQYFKARHKRRDDKANNIVGKVKRAKFMGAWLRLEVGAKYKYENFLESDKSSSQAEMSAKLKIEVPEKLIKVEVPTTRVAIHNFNVNQTVTIYFPSEYVIVFPRIPSSILDSTLRVN